MSKAIVNMTPNPLDIQTIHCSQGDTEAREWGFELHNNGEKIDSSSISDQLVFKAYEGGTEEILPTNGSTQTTSPFKGDIKYPQGLLSDQEFLYRESPTEEDGYAKITDIKGNTLVWNQLNDLSSYTTNTSNGVTFTKNADNSISITGTATGRVSSINLPRFAILSGHKYLLYLSKVLTDIYFRSTVVITASIQQSAIFTATASGNGYFYFDTNATSTATINITNLFVNIFDLTQMFGSGNEPSTVEEFTSLFPLPYYAYNQGTLLSFNGNGIKTVGKNQFDKNTAQSSKTINASGQVVNGSHNVSTYIPILPNTNYYLSNVVSARDGRSGFTYDSSLNPISIITISGASSSTSGFFTAPSNARYMVLSTDTPDICQLEFGTTPSSYEPYTSSTLSLPISTYFPTGMKSAGSVYDELTETKAITRVGEVDLGTLTWNKGSALSDGSGTDYYTNINPYPSAFNSAEANIVSSMFIGVPYRTTWESISKGQMFEIGNGRLVVGADSSYADGNAFKTAMSGVYLYFELATYEETSFTTASLVTENGEIPLSNEDGVLIGKCTEQLSSDSGFFDAKIKLADADGECYSNKIQLHVERSPQ